MLGFVVRRIGLLIPTFFGVSFVSFAFIRLVPGDPVLVLAGQHQLSPELYAQALHRYGFDLPIWRQYLNYLGQLAHGNFGTSIVTLRPVWSEFFARFPATLELSLCAVLFAVVIGIPAGIVAAVYRGKLIDQLTMSGAAIGFSMPIFWWALLLIVVFSGWLHWTPVSGRIDFAYFFKAKTGLMLVDSLLSGQKGAFRSAVVHLILPTIALGTIPLAIIARQTRSAMLEVLGEDYIRTARAKGLAPYRVVGLHALRNALIPVVTVIGLQIGVLATGAILTETIFSWPGVGKWLIEAINRRDYTVLQGGTLLIGIVVMAVNLFVDLLYGLINPRIRHTR
jgi:dipeptide transport system permease protein